MTPEITIDSLTLLILFISFVMSLIAQFAGIVWHASKLKSQINEVSEKVDRLELKTDRLEVETRHDRESLLKIVFQFPIFMEGLKGQIDRFDKTIEQLRLDLKESLSKKQDA